MNECLKRKISGKKNNYKHVVNESRYLNVTRRIGLGFPGSLDRRVGSLLLRITYWYISIGIILMEIFNFKDLDVL